MTSVSISLRFRIHCSYSTKFFSTSKWRLWK